MRLLRITKTNGRPAYVNLERVIYIVYDETRKAYIFYFDGPERSVTAHSDDTENISSVIEQYKA